MSEKQIKTMRNELIAAGKLNPDEELDFMDLMGRWSRLKMKEAMELATRKPEKREVDEAGRRDLEEVRRAFAENPEMIAKVLASASASVDRDRARHRKARPREGLAYALEKLTTVAKGGNYCMVVVGGCWVNSRYKKRGNHLYFQVSGNKYIPSSSKLEKEHVEMLKDMGIVEEEMSDDIYSRHFDDKPRDFKKIVDTIFEIFTRVYRIEKGEAAYIEFVLGKDSDETRAALDGLSEFIPKRSGDNKFKWKWE